MDITVKESKSSWSHTFTGVDLSMSVLKFRELIVESHNLSAPSDVWQLAEVNIINGGKFLKSDSESLEEAKIKTSILVYLKKQQQPTSNSNVPTTSTPNNQSTSVITISTPQNPVITHP